MSEQYTVLWVDDDPSRRETYANLGRAGKLDVIPLKPMEIARAILDEEEDLPFEGNPDLSLVDWYLHKEPGESYAGDGTSMEGILHDRFPDLPIYGFSSEHGTPRFHREVTQSEHRFEQITAPADLDESILASDIKDYQYISSKKGEGLDGVLELLGKEGGEVEHLPSVLPSEFVNGIPSGDDFRPGATLRFARWVRHELRTTPGLLWDSKWTATKLGIDSEKFEEYSSAFSDAEYSGIFSHHGRRWWQADVKDNIFRRAKEQGISISRTWKDAPEIIGVKKEDIATCISCGDSYPETVAAGQIDEDPQFQAHYRCSNIEKSQPEGYEDFRVLPER